MYLYNIINCNVIFKVCPDKIGFQQLRVSIVLWHTIYQERTLSYLRSTLVIHHILYECKQREIVTRKRIQSEKERGS